MAVELPYEITDQIIDHLYLERKTLAACSLVCRAWTARAQTLLFQKVTNVWRLRKMLKNNPQIVPLVHSIEIDPWYIGELFEPTVYRVLGALFALKVSSLDHGEPTFHYPSRKWDMALPSVRSLTLDKCSFATLPSCFDFLECFPSVEYLELRSFAVAYPFAEEGPPELPLRSLVVSYTDMDFVEQLLSTANSSHLRSAVFLLHGNLGELSKLSLLLSHLGHSIVDLTINMSNFYARQTAEIMEALSLPFMRALRTLHWEDTSLRHLRPSAFTWVPLFLEQAARSGVMISVEEISFCFYRLERVPNVEQLMEWWLLDEVLAMPLFNRLERVVFWVRKENVRIAIRGRLRVLGGRKILLFKP